MPDVSQNHSDVSQHHFNLGMNPDRQSFSSESTTSSGASSIASRMGSFCSPERGWGTSPPTTNTPISGTASAVGTQEEVLAVAKEELEDDGDQLMNIPPLPLPLLDGPVKRGRGRPRKHPIPSPRSATKVTKGRSKTGCITCRRRKKKCDEAKPECNNCVKNSVVCEGYPEKTVWQPGRQNGRSSFNFIGKELPTLIDGVDNQTDMLLLDHFTRRVSKILTLWEDENNPFHDLLLPLAMKNRAVMHSLLALSSSHLANSVEDNKKLVVAHHDHFGKTLEALRESWEEKKVDAPSENAATALVLLLDSICSGDTGGTHQAFLNTAQQMIMQDSSSEEDVKMRRFLYEFFTYHQVANSLTSLSPPMESLQLPAFIMQPDASALLGVLDGLFDHVSEIIRLRGRIRERKAAGIHPQVEHVMLLEAIKIDDAIRSWSPAQPQGTPRYLAAQLYRQCTWIFLYRTIQPSRVCWKINSVVKTGLQYLHHLPEQSGTQSILLMPLFLLGCACFHPEHRPEISRRFEGLHAWSGLGNILPAHQVVKEVWRLMDAGDEERSWDWEKIIKDMGFDFLVT